MTKEQVLILKVRYDEKHDKSPHTWNWSDLVGGSHEVEVLNHGSTETVDD
jgi:phage pi2 protein 07